MTQVPPTQAALLQSSAVVHFAPAGHRWKRQLPPQPLGSLGVQHPATESAGFKSVSLDDVGLQTPPQHSALLVQSAPSALQGTVHALLTHFPLAQSSPVLHLAPAGHRWKRQLPPQPLGSLGVQQPATESAGFNNVSLDDVGLQTPPQHSALLVQSAPSALQGTVQALLTHFPLVQSSPALHLAPAGHRWKRQLPPQPLGSLGVQQPATESAGFNNVSLDDVGLQTPPQHSALLVQSAPSALQGTVHAPATHLPLAQSSPAVHCFPAGHRWKRQLPPQPLGSLGVQQPATESAGFKSVSLDDVGLQTPPQH